MLSFSSELLLVDELNKLHDEVLMASKKAKVSARVKNM
jgi:hypothetical protein